MNRAEITKIIQNNQQSNIEQIQTMLKDNSTNIEKILTNTLKQDQKETELALTQHRKKTRSILKSELSKQMTTKILDIKYQTIIISLLSINLFFLLIAIILIKRI